MAQKWIKESFLKTSVGPGHHQTVTAGGNIGAYSPVKWSGSEVIACAANDIDCVGMSLSEDSFIDGDELDVIFSGPAVGVADTRIATGDIVKCGGIGKIMSALTT